MIITLKDCLACAFFYYCHDTNFTDRPCKKPTYYKKEERMIQHERNLAWRVLSLCARCLKLDLCPERESLARGDYSITEKCPNYDEGKR
ncbi:MAG: hypothetical protein OEZ48_00105 [Candidatus Bathyarchaeota archaeon]|nr:hypothetical protein [Candidatus Bathyarchaeota archaeon]MDH5686258.1 hypothetical protein [Candidatus Bathyarchaeota archaeon]